MRSDIRIVELRAAFPEVVFRTPLKFGDRVIERLPLCEVAALVENRAGRRAVGRGAMLMSDFWGWPNPRVPHEVRLDAMRALVLRLGRELEAMREPAHPLEIFHQVEPALPELAEAASRDAGAAEVMPALNQLLCASPVDIALHDAFGLANGIPTFAGYGPDHVNHDLSRYLGPGFRGRYLADHVRPKMAPALPTFHCVGGLDKLREGELTDADPQDGRPVSLDQWIRADGVRCIKIKLRGTDLEWDVDRVDQVARVATDEHGKLGIERAFFSLDPNELCESPAYMIELLRRLSERNPAAERAVLYIEQPTGRDLDRSRHDMRALAALKPVMIDEGCTSLESIDVALELGWSGIALKACKCLSAALLAAAKAQQLGVPYAVQDLTNPGIALFIFGLGMGSVGARHGVPELSAADELTGTACRAPTCCLPVGGVALMATRPAPAASTSRRATRTA